MKISNLLSQHVGDREVYQTVYDEFFTDEFFDSVTNILEIGIQYGKGLRAWLGAFPAANVYGYECSYDRDMVPADIRNNPRLLVQHGYDSTVKDSVEEFFQRIGNVKMDVIIDDGDHQEGSQLATLRNFYPHLSEHGLYIIEDTGPRTANDPFVKEIQTVCLGRSVHVRPVSSLAGVVVIKA